MRKFKYNHAKIFENCPNIKSENDGVYMITNTSNGKRYIGTSSNCFKRGLDHYMSLSKGNHIVKKMQDDFTASGMECFEFRVLYNYDLEDELKKHIPEKLFIAIIKPEYNTRCTKGWEHMDYDGLEKYPKYERVISALLSENILNYLGDYFIEEFDQESEKAIKIIDKYV